MNYELDPAVLSGLNDFLSAVAAEFGKQGPIEKLGTIVLVGGLIGGLFAWLGGRGGRARARDWRLKSEAEERLRKDAERERNSAREAMVSLQRADPLTAITRSETDERDGNLEASYRRLRLAFEEARLGWASVCRHIAEFEGGRLENPGRLVVALRFARLAALLRPEGSEEAALAVGLGDLIAVSGAQASSQDSVDGNWEAELDAALPKSVDGVALSDKLVEESERLFRNTQLGPALLAARRAVALRQRNLGGADRLTLQARVHVVRVLMGWGRYDEALAAADGVVASLKGTFGDEDRDTLNAERLRAEALAHLNRNTDALEAFDSLLAVENRVSGDDHPNTFALHILRARVLSMMGRKDEAALVLQSVLSAQQRAFGRDDKRTIGTHLEWARALHDLNRHEEAIAAFDSVSESPPEVPQTEREARGASSRLMDRASRADSLHKLGRHDEALAEHNAVLQTLQGWPGNHDVVISMVRLLRSGPLNSLGRHDEAQADRDAIAKLSGGIVQGGVQVTQYDLDEARKRG